MSKDEVNMLKETFDVLHLICYNKNTNVTLHRNVFHRPQFQPGETLRKRGKLNSLYVDWEKGSGRAHQCAHHALFSHFLPSTKVDEDHWGL